MQVSHVTRLDYGEEVNESIMEARLGPRDDADQRIRRFHLRVEPTGHTKRYDDGFGNAAHLLTAIRPHTFFQVTVESEVHTLLSDPFEIPSGPIGPLDSVDRCEYLFPSPLVPQLAAVKEMAAPFRPEDPLLTFDAVRHLSSLIHDRFVYRQNVTDVTTSIEDVLEGGQGVCQDFAHLLIGLCRALDIPARYVSGYIVAARSKDEEEPSPSRGAGASHAWVEAFTPTHGWRGFDPTNDLVANTHYVKVAIGRDYKDVAPTRGTYHGTADERLSVSVSALPLQD
ncbi:MAG: transglutaminase family protein [Chloroflexota bacterium]